MTMWRPQLEPGDGPKYLLIVDAIAASVADGRLVAGDRLPPQRDLAHDLGVSLNTVSRAYTTAIERGFLVGEVGRGTYVRGKESPMSGLPAERLTRPQAGPIDFSRNLPAPGHGAAMLADTLTVLAQSPDLPAILDYQTGDEPGRHARAVVGWLERIGLSVDPETIVLTCGAQHALNVVLFACLRPGDVLLCEALTYPPVKLLAERLGLRLVPVAIDTGGIVPEALEAACRTHAAAGLYCLPTLHTPTTATLSADRRAAVAALARRHDLLIIEDDVFGFLPPERPEPIRCHAPERTLFLSSASKSLAPGLRMGWIAAPPEQVRALRAAVSLSCWMPPPLMADITCRWLEDGTADRLNQAQRTEAGVRQTLARRHLGDGRLAADPAGFHVFLTLPDHWSAVAFRVEADRQGVRLGTAEEFTVRPAPAPNAVRLCLSHEVDRARVQRGLSILAGILASTLDSSGLII